jgi:uncharacterized membrane protein
VIVAYIGALLFAAIKAYQGNKLVLPLIGEMAEKWQ